MSNRNNTSRRHSTPGIYFNDTDLTYSVNSLGITTLGVAGETMRGPAFQAVDIKDWTQYNTVFGGTNPMKYKGSQYPKYELPYIAQSYLTQSKQLQVVRTLGLSGVNAGPAWVVTANKYETYSGEAYVIIDESALPKDIDWTKQSTYEYGKVPIKAPTTEYARMVVKTEGTTVVYRYYHAEVVSNALIDVTDGCGQYNNMVVLVLRSRGEHKRSAFVRHPTEADKAQGICDDIYTYDGIEYYAQSVALEPTGTFELGTSCNPGYSRTNGNFTVDASNYGRFTIVVTLADGTEKRYSVSLNPGERNYIYNVLGSNPEDGDCEVYVEELYDVALQQLVNSGALNAINSSVVEYPLVYIVPSIADVDDIMTFDSSSLTKKNKGQRYIFSSTESVKEAETGSDPEPIEVRYSADNGTTWTLGNGVNGYVYTVYNRTNVVTGKHEYFYGAYVSAPTYEYVGMPSAPSGVIFGTENTYNDPVDVQALATDSSSEYIQVNYTQTQTTEYYEKHVTTFQDSTNVKRPTEYITTYNYATDVNNDHIFNNCVKVVADDLYYINNGTELIPVTLDFNNYKEQFRYSSTPWVVSEVKGNAENVELNKLFRFHTISDGDSSASEVKVSIENIDPYNGTFDVLVRSFYDTDYSPAVLERYNNCTLVPGTSGYISLKIGSTDGNYAGKSSYITVEVIENDITAASIPAGFLGYPVRDYSGTGINDVSLSLIPSQPYFRFNTTIDDEVRIGRQYFGVSDLTGIDTDVLKYKGVEAYNGIPTGLTPCFHLDARILNGQPDNNGVITEGTVSQTVTVDGISGYSWTTVSRTLTTEEGIEPRIGDDSLMRGTIYEDKRYRKFSMAFYGGFDGWDWFRTSRSNSDDFRYNTYKGSIDKNSGYGTMFNVVKNPEALGFEPGTKVITSDYYAYLGAIKQFDNSRKTSINVLATPGIDYVNQNALVSEVVNMVEEERNDSIYIVTTPDKPFGAGDSISEMYSAADAVANLEDSGLDSNYTTSFYPWEQYYDDANNQYIYLPITRDVVKSIAYTDNIAFSWYPASGHNRGYLSGVKPRKTLRQSETDVLYDGHLNFIFSIANDGDYIWGDKNLQVADTQLNRISSRRLLLRIKDMLTKATIGLLFDPNDPSCAKTLKKATEDVLKDVKKNRGIVDFRVMIDDSPERVDRLELGCRYFIKKAPNLEYIYFDAVLTPTGFSFSN